MRALIRSRRVALPLAALALAGTGVAAYGAVGDDGPSYRTVSAGIGSVEQELTVSGTIAPSGSSDLAFGTGGTVAQVKVAQGDEVGQGDVVAVLDRASLRAAVDEAGSSLASAKAQLAEDRDAQTTAVSTAATTTTTSTTARATTATTAPRKQSADPQLASQQDAVLKAQTAAGTTLAAAEKALAQQQTACADPVTTTGPTASATPADGTTDAPTTSATTSAVLSEECSDALTAVQSAQTAAGAAQSALQKALTTLSGTLTKALASTQSQPTASAPAASAPAASAPAASTPSAGRGVTAATLAQDQAAIDRAAAELASAKADLAGAVVRAPADGTVVSLAVAQGDDVSAGDTVATVVAPGLTTVTAEVSATQAAQLKAGLDVEVTPAGATEALPGAVGRVEHVATSSTTSDSDPTYTVEVVLDERDLQLAAGMRASVAAVVGSAQDVVVVPASAVSNGTVTVVENGTARRVRVSTGIVGATEIEVTDGLAKGDEVVLADLDADLPSGDSTQQGPGGFGGGGFSGGGAPPSGFRMRG
ncbi:efflux RND transporter periplasmic adaptor subunit [Nocardioides sp. LML1-1-1.1]|uniref:efflux RND transporter periplasmic adaptor subunit n=1 Tax=Nocardioides sp. LML1-1-1.1 TaxID=3135248 RepID=UPI0034233814